MEKTHNQMVARIVTEENSEVEAICFFTGIFDQERAYEAFRISSEYDPDEMHTLEFCGSPFVSEYPEYLVLWGNI